MEELSVEAALRGTVIFPLPDSRVRRALIDADLDGTAIYTKEDAKDIDLCMAELLLTLSTAGDIKEGGYSITMPSAKELLSIRKSLLGKWGIFEDDDKPEIYDGSGLW